MRFFLVPDRELDDAGPSNNGFSHYTTPFPQTGIAWQPGCDERVLHIGHQRYSTAILATQGAWDSDTLLFYFILAQWERTKVKNLDKQYKDDTGED